jgi:voltage-gated potassium channel
MHKVVTVFLLILDSVKRYRRSVIRLLLVFVCALAVGTLALYLTEDVLLEEVSESAQPQGAGESRGPGDVGYAEWFWSTFFTMISPDFVKIKPVSTPGKILVTILIFFGIGFVSIVTAYIASGLVVGRLEAGRGMKKLHLRNHILVCGWNVGARTVVDELVAGARGRDIVIIADLEDSPLPDAGRNIHFVRGDCTDEDVLKRADAPYAHTAIVLADTSGGRTYDEADARTILTVLTIETHSSDVYTCAELIQRKNRDHLERVHADEIVVSGEYGAKTLAHSAFYHGISRILNELLVRTEISSEFYRVPAPEELAGKDFEAALDYFREKHRAIVVAVLRNREVLVNPELGFNLEEGDELAVIARHEPRV